jgi:Spy/CpxP family protein refolding chaperone
MKKSVLALAFAMALPTFAIASSTITDEAQSPPPGDHHEFGGHDGHRPHNGDGPPKGEHGKPGPGQDRGFQKVKQDLQLTDEQAEVFKGAQMEEMRSHFEIAQKYLDKLSPEDQSSMKKEHEAATQLRKDEILKVLTPEQRIKVEEVFAQQRARYEAFKAGHEKPKS